MQHVIRAARGVERIARGLGFARARATTVFLRQSDLDAACGQHCILMALLVLGIFTRDELLDGSGVKGVLGARIRNRARKHHFQGTTTRALKRIVDPLGAILSCEYTNGQASKVRNFAVKHLHDGKLVILGIHCREEGWGHWSLAVGMSGTERRRVFVPRAFLMLDPDEEPPTHGFWNSVIGVDAVRKRGRRRPLVYVDGKRIEVTLHGALAMARK